MKKLVSFIMLAVMVFMLEFNLLKNLLPNIYVWMESILAFGILILIMAWNDVFKKPE